MKAAFLAGVALALPPVLLPLYNPDLFWHLSAGRWMAEHRALPRQDFLSFSMPGAAWLDFEWLTQVIYYGVYGLGGLWGLWLLKVGVLCLCGLAVERILALYGLRLGERLAGMVCWSAGALTHADIRPDLFSQAFFTALLFFLERSRLGKVRPRLAHVVGTFLLFALWSNLHGGFAFGLILLGFYGAAALARPAGYDPGHARGGVIARLGAAAVLGTLANPYGWGPYAVMGQHWIMREELGRFIQEWKPISLGNSFHWPFWPGLAAVCALILARVRKKDLPLGLVGATLYFAYNASVHARIASYFNIAAVALGFCLVQELGLFRKPRAGACLAGLALVYAGYLAWILPGFSWGGVFVGQYVPAAAAEFASQEREVLQGLRLYNPWEWGGYLGWRLWPWYRVYGDGRYLFHPQLAEFQEAALSAEKCQAFLARRAMDGAWMRNFGTMIPATRQYPDGSTKAIPRPWYFFYMPRERWALVYWDPQALLFVDRRRVPPAWLKAREYRYVRPFDAEAFQDAMSRRELPAERVEEERARHDLEMALFWAERRNALSAIR